MKKIIFVISMFIVISAGAQTVNVARYLGDRQCAVSLTFDDGMQEHYTLVAPHLDRYGLKGTFGINGKYIGDIDDRYAPRMTWEECRSLAASGHEICSHTWSHPNLYYTGMDSVIMEIEKNDSAIIKEIGIKPMSFCIHSTHILRPLKRLVKKAVRGRVPISLLSDNAIPVVHYSRYENGFAM